MHNSNKKTRVLFVCLGNICRSPMAESVFKFLVNKAGVSNDFLIESAGTAGYHIGEWPDHRTISTLKSHGIEDVSRARQLVKADLDNFDWILAMDLDNLADILLLQDSASTANIELFRKYDSFPENQIVPDPYYGSLKDFEHVYEIVHRTSINLLNSIK